MRDGGTYAPLLINKVLPSWLQSEADWTPVKRARWHVNEPEGEAMICGILPTGTP